MGRLQFHQTWISSWQQQWKWALWVCWSRVELLQPGWKISVALLFPAMTAFSVSVKLRNGEAGTSGCRWLCDASGVCTETFTGGLSPETVISRSLTMLAQSVIFCAHSGSCVMWFFIGKQIDKRNIDIYRDDVKIGVINQNWGDVFWVGLEEHTYSAFFNGNRGSSFSYRSTTVS